MLFKCLIIIGDFILFFLIRLLETKNLQKIMQAHFLERNLLRRRDYFGNRYFGDITSPLKNKALFSGKLDIEKERNLHEFSIPTASNSLSLSLFHRVARKDQIKQKYCRNHILMLICSANY